MQQTEEQRRRRKKKQDAVDVLLDMPDTEPAPPAVDEQCNDKTCKQKIARLERECNDLM